MVFMNERIDELMIQAGARFEFLHGVHYDDFQYRKFAELIIKETLQVARAGIEYGDGMEDAVYKYFGVEDV